MTEEHFAVFVLGEVAASYPSRAEAVTGAELHLKRGGTDRIDVRDERGSIVWTPTWQAAD